MTLDPPVSQPPYNPPPRDEIDFIDVFRFLWRSRYSLLIGSLVGAILGASALILRPGGFKTAFHLTVDSMSLPAITADDLLIKAFNEAASSAAIAAIAIDNLLKADPRLSESLKGRRNDLILQQTQASIDNRVFFLGGGKGTQEFALILRLPVKSLNESSALAGEQLANAVAETFNKTVEDGERAAAKGALADVRRAIAAFDSTEAANVQALYQERSKLRSELASLEVHFMSRLPEATLRQIQASFVTQIVAPRDNDGPADTSQTELQVARVLRLLGGLQEAKRISQTEASSLFKRVAQLQAALSRNTQNLDSNLKAYRSLTTSMSKAMEKMSVPVDREKRFLPRFKADDALFGERVKNGQIETPARRASLGAIAGFLMGGLLSLGFCLTLSFLKANGRAIMNEKA